MNKYIILGEVFQVMKYVMHIKVGEAHEGG